ncbi:MAG: tRNA-uridine aminocarboxypropyltransferase [Mariprofundaceae bacterium]|nr:tRNA-uridine aminocarboxypropyltransferase [Mariprofundaceae bacterium]
MVLCLACHNIKILNIAKKHRETIMSFTMIIYLLTHQREHHRKTNTGQLVSDILGEACQVITWYRKEPDSELLNQMKRQKIGLLYPNSDSRPLNKKTTPLEAWDAFILLDGTWQEAQKMYNQSPYLKTCPKIAIQRDKKSIYKLRRNQKDFGLCTAECAYEVLIAHNMVQPAMRLEACLIAFVATHANKGLICDE